LFLQSTEFGLLAESDDDRLPLFAPVVLVYNEDTAGFGGCGTLNIPSLKHVLKANFACE
jgi:hypothetical protein